MRNLLQLYPGDVFYAIFTNAVVQATAVLIAAWALARGLKTAGAAARYGVWLVALAGAALAPLTACTARWAGWTSLEVALPAWDEHRTGAPLGAAARGHPVTPDIEVAPQDMPPVLDRAAAGVRTKPPGAAPEAMVHAPLSRSQQFRAGLALVFLVWLAGVAVLLVRLIHGFGVQAVLRRSATPLLEDADNAAALAEVRAALGTKSLPPLAVSPLPSSPICFGVLNPIVIIPAALTRILKPHELRDVLIHECAHVMQRDHLVGLLQRLAGILFWFHPLVRKASHELARAREEVCDNYVLHRGDAPGYARMLLELAEKTTIFHRTPTAVGLVHPSWTLEERVQGILDQRRKLMTRMNTWAFAGVAAVLIGLGVTLAGCKAQEEKKEEMEKEKAAAEPIRIAPEKVRFLLEPVDEEKRSGLYAISAAYPIKIPLTSAALFAQAADGRMDAPREKTGIELVGKLPGKIACERWDFFTAESITIKEGRIRVQVKFTEYRGPVAGEGVPKAVYIRCDLPALPAGKYNAQIDFSHYSYSSNKDSKLEGPHKGDPRMKALVCEFEVGGKDNAALKSGEHVVAQGTLKHAASKGGGNSEAYLVTDESGAGIPLLLPQGSGGPATGVVEVIGKWNARKPAYEDPVKQRELAEELEKHPDRGMDSIIPESITVISFKVIADKPQAGYRGFLRRVADESTPLAVVALKDEEAAIQAALAGEKITSTVIASKAGSSINVFKKDRLRALQILTGLVAAPRGVRAKAIFDLFAMLPSANAEQAKAVLGGAAWLKESHIQRIDVLGGHIPIEMTEHDTVFRLYLFADKDKWSDWVIYFRLSGNPLEVKDAVDFFSGNDGGERTRLKEFALCLPDGTAEKSAPALPKIPGKTE